MLPYRDSRITTIAIVVFFLLVLGYAYFEARGLLYGPRISLSSKTTEVHNQFVEIKGTAERISSLSMNGKQISVTEDGAFNELYLLSPGLNRIILDATDKYGRRRSQVVQIVYTPLTDSTGSTSLTASSSPQTTTSSSTPAVAQ